MCVFLNSRQYSGATGKREHGAEELGAKVIERLCDNR